MDLLIHLAMQYEDLADDEIAELISRHLLELADKHLLPRPRYEAELGRTRVRSKVDHDRMYLSRDGIAELRALIRKDAKERNELMLPWLSLLIGLLGALTGSVAVIGALT